MAHRQAAAWGSQRMIHGAGPTFVVSRGPKSRASIAADGLRGFQLGESGILGAGFMAELMSEFVDAVAVAARRGIGGNGEEFANLLKSQFSPELQDDDFALGSGESREGVHGRAFQGKLVGTTLEPALGLELAGDASKKAAPVVQRMIAIRAQAVELRLSRLGIESHQLHEGLLKRVFRFGVAEPKRATIKNQAGGLRLIEGLQPWRAI